MRLVYLFALVIVTLSCKENRAKEPVLSAEEEQQIFAMAKSYFLPMSPFDWENLSETDQERISLGKSLFYDKKLSQNQTQNCASCHDMSRFGQDNLRVSPGDAGVLGVRNVPTVLNASFQYAQFWDARMETVEEQAAGPIFGEVEMGMQDTLELLDRLNKDSKYPELFGKAFPDADTLITLNNVKSAIGSFERTLLTRSRFDDYLEGDEQALNYAEKKGIKSFIDQGCIPCHSGILLGGNMEQEFAIFGYYWDYTNSHHLDKGKYHETLLDKDMFFFKVPGLRNVAETAPYFHDGSVENLEESIRIMSLAELNFNMEEEDVSYIVAFFRSLTGKVPDYAHEEKALPFED